MRYFFFFFHDSYYLYIPIFLDKDNLFIPNIRISFVKVEYGILVFYIFMAN